MVLALGEAILFFRRCSHNDGLLYCDAQDIKHGLTGSVTWVERTAQVEMIVNTIQEGCRAIMDVVIEKKTKDRGPGHPQVLRGASQSSAAACNVDNWMQGLNKGTYGGEVRKVSNVCTYEYRQVGAHA